MRMDGQDESSNVEDVRGMGGGGGGGFGIGGRGLGIGSIAIAVIAGWIFGINPLALLGMMEGGGAPSRPAAAGSGAEAAGRRRRRALRLAGAARAPRTSGPTSSRSRADSYQPPKLVLFSGSWPTACGQGQAAMGPFYCPNDQKVYIDLRFYKVLEQKLGAPGQFAQAYVIAHEVGHHVQKQLGIMDKVDALRGRGEPGAGQRPQRPRRAAGRLLRRRLGGTLAEGAGLAPRAGRHRDSAQRRRRRSATTRCSASRRERSFPSRSRTAPARSASTGSSVASRAAASIAAIRSRVAATSRAGCGARAPRSSRSAARRPVQAAAQRDVGAGQEQQGDAGRLGPAGVDDAGRGKADPADEPEREDEVPDMLFDRLVAPVALVPGLHRLELGKLHGGARPRRPRRSREAVRAGRRCGCRCGRRTPS